MKYILVCDSEIINESCSTGFKSEVVSNTIPQYLTLHEFKELLPISILFLCACYVWKKLC